LNKGNKKRIRLEIYEERGGRCEREGCFAPASDLHHGIIGDKKRFKDVLFCKENLFLSCRECNISRIMDNEEQRQTFWCMNSERYGEERMLSWLNSIDSKLPLFIPA
jgi:hypothetical protein